MASLEELRAERIKKLESLTALGIDAYSTTSARTHEVAMALEQFDSLSEGGEAIVVAGRVMGSRGQGALIFADLYDGTGKIQIVIKTPESPDEARVFFEQYVDAGDFVEVSGVLFATKTGQKSIMVERISMLSKSLRPLPDKYHGIQDEELRMRLRYLDMLVDPELRSMFERKAKFWQVTRRFLAEKNFLEVETQSEARGQRAYRGSAS